MRTIRTRALWLGAFLLAALVLASGLALAQTPTIGLVDTSRLAAEYKAMQQLNDQYNAFQRDQEEALTSRQKVMMLSEADYTKYFDLRQGAAPTEATQKQISDLEALAKTREDRFRALSDKKDRTADEQKEFDDLSKIYTARMVELRALQDGATKAVQAKRDELSKVITDSLDAAIKSVAESKKLTLVVAKEAVLFGGTDITTEVLEKLNAPAPAPRPAK